MTWLDQYAHALLAGVRPPPGSFVPVETNFRQIAKSALAKTEDYDLRHDDRAFHRFDADMLVSLNARLRTRWSAFHVSKSLLRDARHVSTPHDRTLLSQYLRKRRILYLDIPQDALDLPCGIEIPAVFIKKAKVVDARAPRLDPFSGTTYEYVVGRRGGFSSQRLTVTKFLFNGSVEMTRARTVRDAVTASPMHLLIEAGMTPDGLRDLFTAIAAASIACEQNAATKLPQIPLGDPARLSLTSDPSRTLFDIYRTA